MRFIDGLTFQLHFFMTRESVSDANFDEVIDIAWQIKMVRGQEKVEREAKRPRSQGGFNSAPFGGQFQHDRGRHFRQAQSARPFHRGASSGHGSHSSHHGHSSLGALPAQSLSCAPPVQGSSMPCSSTSYPGARGSLQFSPPAPRSCFECGEFRHMWRQCPRHHQGLSQQRSYPLNSAPGTSPPAQSARVEVRSGGGQAHFYALPAIPDIIASDVLITSSVSVCHKYASVLFDPGSTYSYVSSYFAYFLDMPRESLVSTFHVSTTVGDTIVMDHVVTLRQ
ncbi:uncharacterized protein [Nicotiana tomentosiformis]|uniref:uncharacterized protein n=1 Tax=Nicotiana tomentosiformis TaxID=4098 RepID=UPI00388C591E